MGRPTTVERARWKPLALGLLLLLALSALFQPRGVGGQGWYPLPGYDLARQAAGFAPRAHALTILNQCSTPASPKYYIWGGVLADGSAAADGWIATDGYSWTPWSRAYSGGITSRIGAQLFNEFNDKCNGGHPSRVFVMGGANADNCGGTCSTLYAMNFSNDNNSWTLVGIVNVPARQFATAHTVVANTYLTGGLLNGAATAEVWRAPYNGNSVATSWILATPLPQPLYGHTGGSTSADQPFVCGGTTASGQLNTNCYQGVGFPASGSWNTVAQASSGFNRWMALAPDLTSTSNLFLDGRPFVLFTAGDGAASPSTRAQVLKSTAATPTVFLPNPGSGVVQNTLAYPNGFSGGFVGAQVLTVRVGGTQCWLVQGGLDGEAGAVRSDSFMFCPTNVPQSGATMPPAVGNCPTVASSWWKGNLCSQQCAPNYLYATRGGTYASTPTGALSGVPLRCLPIVNCTGPVVQPANTLPATPPCSTLPLWGLQGQCAVAPAPGYSLCSTADTLRITCNNGTLVYPPLDVVQADCDFASFVAPIGTSLGGCAGVSTLRGCRSCTLALDAPSYVVASGSLTITCNSGVLSPPPVVTPAPCPALDLSTFVGGLVALGTCPTSGLSAHAFNCSLGCQPTATATQVAPMTCSYGSWIALAPSMPDCKLTCPAPSVPTGGAPGNCSGSLDGHGGSCTLEPASGYRLLSGSLAVACNDGALSPLPVFEELPCPFSALPLTMPGAIAGSCPVSAGDAPVPSGQSCALDCATGYTYVSGGALSCSLGEFSGAQPLCKLQCTVSVGALPTGLLAGSCSAVPLGGDGGHCTLALQSGYALAQGSLTIRCEDGAISDMPTLYEPCSGSDLLPLGSNVTLRNCPDVGEVLGVGSACHMGCDPGFSSAVSNVRKCINGTWSGIGPVCELSLSPCGVDAMPPLGFGGVAGTCPEDATSAPMTSGSSCTLDCGAGFTFVVGGEQTCLLGAFNGSLPLCVADCSVPSALPAGVLEGACSGVAFLSGSGGECELAVATGWALQPGSSLTLHCSNGSLSDLPVAAPASCATSSLASNYISGLVSFGNCPAMGTAPHGFNCSLGCDSSATATQNNSVGCSYGQWHVDDALPDCARWCSAPTVPLGGSAGNCTGPLDGHGGRCMLQAADGYDLSSGSLTIICNDGVQSPLPTFAERSCSGIDLLPLASNVTWSNCSQSSDVPAGQSCGFACDAGYDISSSVVTCSRGAWNAARPTCTPRPCTLAAPANSAAGGSCGASLVSGDSCSFTCAEGFVLDQPTTSCALGVLSAVQLCVPAPVSFVIVAAPQVSFLRAPASIAAGDQLGLQLSLLLDPVTAAAAQWLRFDWRCSDAMLQLWDPALLAGPANSSSLTLRNDVLQAGHSYEFSVRVTDMHPLHRVANESDQQPWGGAITTVAVTAAVSFTVPAQSGVDPCVTQNPCLNGGRCVADRTTSGNSFVLRCVCPTTPFVFFGPRCSFGVLACPGCVAPFRGGALLSLYGIGFDALRSATLAGQELSFAAPSKVNASSSEAVAQTLARLGQPGLSELDCISFRAPPIHVNETYSPSGMTASSRQLLRVTDSTPSSFPASYERLSLSFVAPSSSALQQANYSSLVFYTPSQCLAEGQWTDDGLGGCLSCPTGGFCPGGGRVWPLAGYWSYSEYQRPLECRVPEACLGVKVADTAATGGDAASLYMDTASTCADGYTGSRCSDCEAGFYALLNHCYACGSTQSQRATVTATVLFALVAMSLLSVAVAFLKPRPLAFTVASFCVLQELAMAGVTGAASSPIWKKELSTLFSWINLINFDIELLRPGCGGMPTFRFVDKFWVTLLLLLMAGVLFTLACVARFCVAQYKAARAAAQAQAEVEGGKSEGVTEGGNPPAVAATSSIGGHADSANGNGNPCAANYRIRRRASLVASVVEARRLRSPQWVDLTERLQHAMLILLCIFYLRLCILQFKAMRCETLPVPPTEISSNAQQLTANYLSEDGATRCLSSEHIGLLCGVVLLFVLYTLGFPLCVFVLLTRAFADDSTGGVVGWLRRRMRILRPGVAPEAAGAQVASDSPKGPQPLKGEAADSAALTADSSALMQQRARKFGFLFLGYQPKHFTSYLQVFFMHAWYAGVSVFLVDRSALLRLFLFGLASTLQAMYVAVKLPYRNWTGNVRKLGLSVAQLGHAAVMLGLQSGRTKSGYFVTTLLLFGIIMMLLSFRRSMKLPCGKRGTVDEHTKGLPQLTRDTDDDDDDGGEESGAVQMATIQRTPTSRRVGQDESSMPPLPPVPLPPRESLLDTRGQPTLLVDVDASEEEGGAQPLGTIQILSPSQNSSAAPLTPAKNRMLVTPKESMCSPSKVRLSPSPSHYIVQGGSSPPRVSSPQPLLDSRPPSRRGTQQASPALLFERRTSSRGPSPVPANSNGAQANLRTPVGGGSRAGSQLNSRAGSRMGSRRGSGDRNSPMQQLDMPLEEASVIRPPSRAGELIDQELADASDAAGASLTVHRRVPSLLLRRMSEKMQTPPHDFAERTAGSVFLPIQETKDIMPGGIASPPGPQRELQDYPVERGGAMVPAVQQDATGAEISGPSRLPPLAAPNRTQANRRSMRGLDYFNAIREKQLQTTSTQRSALPTMVPPHGETQSPLQPRTASPVRFHADAPSVDQLQTAPFSAPPVSSQPSSRLGRAHSAATLATPDSAQNRSPPRRASPGVVYHIRRNSSMLRIPSPQPGAAAAVSDLPPAVQAAASVYAPGLVTPPHRRSVSSVSRSPAGTATTAGAAAAGIVHFNARQLCTDLFGVGATRTQAGAAPASSSAAEVPTAWSPERVPVGPSPTATSSTGRATPERSGLQQLPMPPLHPTGQKASGFTAASSESALATGGLAGRSPSRRASMK